jgi:hypothetical protein
MDRTKNVKGTFNGREFNLVIPETPTAELRSAVFAGLSAGDPLAAFDGIVNALSSVIISWDIHDGDKPYPPTTENISLLPLQFVMRLADSIGTAWPEFREQLQQAMKNRANNAQNN